MREEVTSFNSTDGLLLRGTFLYPEGDAEKGVLLVHGLITNRDEGGFYSESARRLGHIGVASLRFDLRGHGKSEGSYEDLTLTGVMNDIGAAFQHLRDSVHGLRSVTIIAASFGGGLSAYWAAEHQDVDSLILLNPLLDYSGLMRLGPSYFKEGRLTEEGVGALRKQGWLEVFTPPPPVSFRIGTGLINELSYIRPYEKMSTLRCPVLTLHGDHDVMAPYETAKRFGLPNKESRFVTIEGADHRFIKPGDYGFSHPDTARYRERVFAEIEDWIKNRK